jgi:hypothetical protein
MLQLLILSQLTLWAHTAPPPGELAGVVPSTVLLEREVLERVRG